MESKVCKKCNKILPERYKYKSCEACRGRKTEKLKSGLVKAASVGIPLILAVATKGKIGSKKS